jgi:hypothetical protein
LVFADTGLTQFTAHHQKGKDHKVAMQKTNAGNTVEELN